MKLHLVGGFLGSGKTTAIVQSSKALMAAGQVVGVITNDQGKFLVDTAFVRLANIPAVEVTGGCFCCNFDDLDGRLGQLIEANHPDVIFAESVGSCADIVATVVKPLLQLKGPGVQPNSFSVFADARLLRRRLLQLDMPFSDDVMYIYDQQLEEAGLIVVNKIDLLSPADLDMLKDLVSKKFLEKPVVYQMSLSPEGIHTWLEQIQSGEAPVPTSTLNIDYQRYGAGEAQLAWLDQEMQIIMPGEGQRLLFQQMISALLAALEDRQGGIGHIKFILRAGDSETKLSLTTIPDENWPDQLPEIQGTEVVLLINARVEMPAEELQDLIKNTWSRFPIQMLFLKGMAFHPAEPNPTYRFR
jgi:Ni2+-binding GTPase involved in maturation of urease and hydrogenase